MFGFVCFISLKEQLEWGFSVRKREIDDAGEVEDDCRRESDKVGEQRSWLLVRGGL